MKRIQIVIIFLFFMGSAFLFAQSSIIKEESLKLSALPEGKELLKNNDFDNGTNEWSLVGDNGADVSFDIDNTSLMNGTNSGHIVLNAYGSGNYNWEIGLNQGIPGGVEAGKKYHIEYQVKASEACTIENWVQQTHDPWDPIYQTFMNVTTEVQTFVDTFVVSETDEQCQWSFALGAVGVDSIQIWIDNVHFIEISAEDTTTPPVVQLPDGQELLRDNSFDNSADSLWKFSVADGAVATFDIDTNGVLEGNNSAHIAITTQGSGPYNWEIGLYQSLSGGVKAGKTYYIQYTAKASKEAIIETWVQQWHDNYDPIYNSELSLTTEAQTFVDTFFVTNPDSQVVWGFELGAMGTDIDVWIDDVHFIDITPVNHLVGHWNFNDSANVAQAKVGNDLIMNGEYQVVTGPNSDDGAISIGAGSNCLVNHGMSKGGTVDSYTLVFDVKIPDISSYHSLYQTILENNSDATVFVNTSGNLGLGATGYTDAALEADKWYRLAVVYKANERIDYYINGVKELEGNSSDSYVGQVFPLDSAGVLLFADNDGEDGLIVVSDVKLYDTDLNDEEIEELGGFTYSNLVGHWDFNDPANLTKAEVGNDLVLNGTHQAVLGFKDNDGAVQIDAGSNYLLNHGISKGGTVNAYTMVFDILVPELGSYHALYQTILENNSDATVFINTGGNFGLGASGYTSTALEANRWYRLAIAYKANERIDYYINGVKELEGNFSDSYVNQIFPLDSAGVLLFADNDGEDVTVIVSDVKLYDGALDDKAIEELGGIIVTDINESTDIPNEYSIEQNYPNPFNPTTTIRYALPKTSHVSIAIYNALGQKVTELVNEKMNAGRYQVNFDAAQLSSGIYFYSINAGNFRVTKKMLLLK